MRERRNESERPKAPRRLSVIGTASGAARANYLTTGEQSERSGAGAKDATWSAATARERRWSRRRTERGKPPMSRPQPAEESDPAEWSRSGDESAEAA